ncbi:MAG: hypothetical protein V7785_13625 [Bermanella sp.]
MKNSLIKFLLVISISNIASIPTLWAQELKMGYFILSPHIIRTSNDKPIGSAVDWFNQYVAPQMSHKIIWEKKEKPLKRLLGEIESGNTDISVLFAKRPDREAYMYYPKKSYIDTVPSLLVRSDNPMDTIGSLSDIKQLKIGFVKGGFIPPGIKKANLNFKLITGKDWQNLNLKKLESKRIDGIFAVQDISARYLARSNNLLATTKLLRMPVKAVKNYTVFSKASTNLDIVSDYEKALEKAEMTVPYRKFIETWVDPGN